ncbi:LysR family transcriptional regulator [Nocardia sp. NPDC058058]|uniref:LysR family transcriptional regulator n=1 Tax=Nocardia sp. NPDC058058 TaxID=3346317 RepID=UPI0036D87C1F
MISQDIRQLRSFLVVADELNITHASGRLHISQQTLSAQMQQLERAMQVPLLVRTSRGVRLTPAGRELARGGSALIADLDRLIERVHEADRGTLDRLRIVSGPRTTELFTIEVADALEATVPGLEVELVIAHTRKQERSLLISGEVDAALMWMPHGDESLCSTVVSRNRRAVALPPKHPLAAQESVVLADLGAEPIIRPNIFLSEHDLRQWIIDPRPDGTPVLLGPMVDKLDDCMTMVARGKGIWLAPEPLGFNSSPATVEWRPIIDAASSELAIVRTANESTRLIGRLTTEILKVAARTRTSIGISQQLYSVDPASCRIDVE